MTLRDRRTGHPIERATVTLAADMPSMPLAHSVRPATASAGIAPGTYHGTLELEMAGRWVVTVRIAGPHAEIPEEGERAGGRRALQRRLIFAERGERDSGV